MSTERRFNPDLVNKDQDRILTARYKMALEAILSVSGKDSNAAIISRQALLDNPK